MYIQLISDGILLGLTLTILLGPIFVALTQTGIQKGIRAGLAVGAGVWISDIIVIVGAYFFIVKISLLIKSNAFHFWMGMAGGVILIVMGIISIIKKTPETISSPTFSAKSFFEYFSKGFTVNFINPFTFVFWISVMGTYITGKGISAIEATLLFGSIMITIITTDSLKVIMAKAIRSKMTHDHMQLFSRIAGILLVIFGIVMLIRTNVL